MSAKRKARRVPKSSREWFERFRANEKPEALPREGPWLSNEERKAVVASIQEFRAAAEMMNPEGYASLVSRPPAGA